MLLGTSIVAASRRTLRKLRPTTFLILLIGGIPIGQLLLIGCLGRAQIRIRAWHTMNQGSHIPIPESKVLYSKHNIWELMESLRLSWLTDFSPIADDPPLYPSTKDWFQLISDLFTFHLERWWRTSPSLTPK